MALRAVEVSQSPEEKFREYLASRPDLKRFSQPQKELVAHIFARHKHFDTNELLDDLKEAGRAVSRATVYRTLKLLVDAGLLRRIEVGARTIFDHDYGYPAHDHLVCTQCGTMDAMRQVLFRTPGLFAVEWEVGVLLAMAVVFLVSARWLLRYLENRARVEGKLSIRWQ